MAVPKNLVCRKSFQMPITKFVNIGYLWGKGTEPSDESLGDDRNYVLSLRKCNTFSLTHQALFRYGTQISFHWLITLVISTL